MPLYYSAVTITTTTEFMRPFTTHINQIVISTTTPMTTTAPTATTITTTTTQSNFMKHFTILFGNYIQNACYDTTRLLILPLLL